MEFTLDDFVQYIQLKGNEGTKEKKMELRQ